MLDDDSLLLEYMLGDERSYVWAVTRTEVAAFELPGRAQIEKEALRFHKLLTANQPLPGESFEQRQDRVREANALISEEAASFRQTGARASNDQTRPQALIDRARRGFAVHSFPGFAGAGNGKR